MKHCLLKNLLLIAITLLTSTNAHASELTAIQLQEYCGETEKSFLGQKFDAEKAEICKGYIMGFFDSMVILDQVIQKQQFCVPKSLPKTQNNIILTSWINKNKNIADTTTASVALFSAYSAAFPCK